MRELKAGRRPGIRGVARKEKLVSLAFLVPEKVRLDWAEHCDKIGQAYAVEFERMFYSFLKSPAANIADVPFNHPQKDD